MSCRANERVFFQQHDSFHLVFLCDPQALIWRGQLSQPNGFRRYKSCVSIAPMAPELWGGADPTAHGSHGSASNDPYSHLGKLLVL